MFEEAKQEFYDISRKYGLNASYATESDLERHGFLRGRLCDPENLRPGRNVFSYPPPEFCKSFGRANVPGHPVFYASQALSVIADEVRASNGDILHIAMFYTPQRVKMKIMPLLHKDFCGESEWRILRDALYHSITNDGDSKFGTNPVPLRVEKLEAPALAFRGNDYRETAVLSHYWLNHPDPEYRVDGIVYPSLRDEESCNFALSRLFVDANLSLFRVFACLWDHESFRVQSTGVYVRDGSIEWREPNDDDDNCWENWVLGDFRRHVTAPSDRSAKRARRNRLPWIIVDVGSSPTGIST